MNNRAKLSAPAQLAGDAVDRFRAMCEDLLAAGVPWIEVDFSESTYLDSSALGALVVVGKHCRQAGGELLLAYPQPDIAKLFEALKIETLFFIKHGRGSVGEGDDNDDDVPESPLTLMK